jgi:hypothetical protein
MTMLFGDLSPLVPLPLGIGEGKGEEKERGVCTPLRRPVWGKDKKYLINLILFLDFFLR